MTAETLPQLHAPSAVRIRASLTVSDRIDNYMRVLGALMLRDMRTRFAGSYWGYMVQVLWPVTHMFFVAGSMAFRHMPSPIGDSALIFGASGAVPALAFQYISREVMKGIQVNKPLTYYPQVKVLDVMFARILTEIVGSFLGAIVIFIILYAFQVDPLPIDIFTSLGGYLCAILLGVGVGTINVAIVQFFPGWSLGYVLLNILIYLASGVVFLPNAMPEQLYSIMKWNPLLQIVEWVRLGYDPTLPVTIDYLYILQCIGCTLALGLLLERFVSRRAGV